MDFDLCGPEDGDLVGSTSVLSDGDGELCWTAPMFAGDCDEELTGEGELSSAALEFSPCVGRLDSSSWVT